MFHVEQKRVDPGQPTVQAVGVMKNTPSKAPAAAQASEPVVLKSAIAVNIGKTDFTLILNSQDEIAKYEALQTKYPAVHNALRDVAAGLYEVADQSRKAVLAIVESDMKHEESGLMLRAWGYGKDRVSLIHRVVDSAPKTREMYLKGDMGLKKAVMQARLEDPDGEASGNERGGKRGPAKKGGTKAQRKNLEAIAETVAKEVKDWIPSKLPIKVVSVRLGSYPWLVTLQIQHKPLPPSEAVDPAQPEGKK